MFIHLRLVGFALLLASSALAQSAHIPGRYNEIKAENGLILAWHGSSEDRAAGQVDVYDEEGDLLISLAPLRFVPEAKLAAVWDVSALPGRIIAVAVDYRQAPDKVPAASLLCFDFKGKLSFALALDPSREARAVTIDGKGDIWTFTRGSGSKPPSEVPLVVEYSSSGEVIKEVLKRSDFPEDAKLTREDDVVGAAGFGHTSGLVWFWLPSSRNLVTLNATGSLVEKSITDLPHQSKLEVPIRVALLGNGDFLAEVKGRQDKHQPGQFAFFAKARTSKKWGPFYPPCPSCSLIGNDDTKAFFARGEGDEIAIYSAPLPHTTD